MNREDLMKEMKDSIGTKDPVVFFNKMVDAFGILFDKIDALQKDLKRAQSISTLAIHWDQRIADTLVADEITHLRKTGKQPDGTNIYAEEIDALQKEYMLKVSTKDYPSFCTFWQDLLGYHPFLENRK